MSPFDNAATIPALAAIGGSVAGALGSTVNAWIVQRHRIGGNSSQKGRSARAAVRSLHHESARLLVDALQHSLENPTTLVPIYTLISRIRLNSSTAVIEGGERLIATILEVLFRT